MKCFLIRDGQRYKCAPPHEDADHAIVTGTCPHCKADPFKVGGKRMHVVNDRAYEAEGHCLDCMAFVGTIRYEPSTIFGIEEDARTLAGPWRVY